MRANKEALVALRSLFAPWWDIKAFYIRKKYGLNKEIGLCTNYTNYMWEVLGGPPYAHNLYYTKEYNSIVGEIAYPVTFTQYMCTMDAKTLYYLDIPKYSGEYGKARRELLEKLIKACDED